MKPVDFHDYWEHQNKLLELSYKESIRQREERKCKNKTSVPVTQKKKLQSGKCCKQEKPNALDEFWTSLGEPDKCKTPIR